MRSLVNRDNTSEIFSNINLKDNKTEVKQR